MNIKKIALAAALPVAMMVAAPAQAEMRWFTIDDFDDSPTTKVFSNETNPKDAPGGNIPPGWVRQISAEGLTGDPVSTEVCSNCKVGHFSSGAGSTGIGEWIYSGPAWDMSGDEPRSLTFDYAADHAGAIVSFMFSDDGLIYDTFSSGALASTGSGGIDTLTAYSMSWYSSTSPVDYSAITDITIRVDGSNVQDLDFSIDNTMAHVPEPATFALMGLGLAGLGWKKRRAVAK